ncbi:MAG: Rpn family recombination-promoting nuclease/putative transposase [Lachnospiraceae bacterium]|nr:Rpn family recombination-promoting nuclease/putative transposase [Lachnospiraceae bacterium]
MIKKFNDLNLNDSFLFAAFFENPDNCKMMLEILMEQEISDLSVKSEHNLLVSSDVKCIRLDIYATDELHVNYNIEAQNQKRNDLVKRSRFYQGEMDVASLKPGEGYNKLEKSYVIFICTFDPFEKGLFKYTFEETCKENGMPLGDETAKIFFNTKGTNKENVSEELIEFFQYFENTTDEYVEKTNNHKIQELHKRVKAIKMSREWEAGYMKYEEIIRNTLLEGWNEGKNQGLIEGKIEGKIEGLFMVLERFGELPDNLVKKINETDDIDTLNCWFRQAIEAKSITDFTQNIS